MDTNNIVLNRLFTQKTFSDLIDNNENPLFTNIVSRYLTDSSKKTNGELISQVYEYLSTSYRNEYFFKNTLLNKLLLGRHNVNTTTALTEIPVDKSIADFVLINGTATVYEIKTDLDTIDRLETQIENYFKAFINVYVVTSERYFEKVYVLFKTSPVGILVLNKSNRLQTKKKSFDDYSRLDSRTIFKLLHKREFEEIILSEYGYLPDVPPVFYYEECYNLFSKINLHDCYRYSIWQLKKRNRIVKTKFTDVPVELRFLVYFSKYREKDYQKLDEFLVRTHGE